MYDSKFMGVGRKNMKILTKITMIIIIFLGILYLNSYFPQAKENTNLFNDIINCAEGNVVEYGLKTSFETKDDGEKTCLSILKDLDNKFDIQVSKENNIYSVDFENDVTNGYIESVAEGKHNTITINISKKDSANNLLQLKNRVEAIIEKRNVNHKYFEYVKAKISDSDLLGVNSKVTDLLKNNNCKNIQTISINNGYSTTAYTRQFENKLFEYGNSDLNYAVCKYTSGNYIIIGTPIIIETY